MKILQITSTIDPRAGGVATSFVKLSIAQQRAGLEVTAVSTYRDSEEISQPVAELRSAGIATEMIGPGRGTLCRVPGMHEQVRRLIAFSDIVHIHAIWEEIQHIAAVEAKKARVPYLISPHGMLHPWSLSQRAIKKKIYLALRLRHDLQNAAALHVTAPAERESLAPLQLRPPVIVEPLGIDLAEFEHLPSKGWLRAKYPQIADRPIILFLGRLHYKKGLDLLISTFADADTGGAVLVLAGPGDDNYIASLRTEIANRHLDDCILFTGMLRGIERIRAFVDADLFVLPSHQENFGIAVIESLAAGCPVLISENVNIADQVVSAGVGAAHRLDAPALRDALALWMRDEKLRHAAAARARDFVWNSFDWTRIGPRWVEHYGKLK